MPGRPPFLSKQIRTQQPQTHRKARQECIYSARSAQMKAREQVEKELCAIGQEEEDIKVITSHLKHKVT